MNNPNQGKKKLSAASSAGLWAFGVLHTFSSSSGTHGCLVFLQGQDPVLELFN